MRWQQLTRPQQDAVVRLALLAVSAGPDLVVTLARRLLGRRGVQLGPAIAAIGVAAVAPPVGRWAFDHQSRVGGAALLGVGAAVVAAPVLGAIAPVTVVGRASPLWALAVSAAARGGLAGALAASVVRAGRRDVSRS
ncbi:hypothetical protein DMO24_03305 [Modestobacter versicolor]|uniref:Uncharacterized protein n=1 Tax=Modestobacter versicolor TaxID=429133 RepID=A0A323VD77_9ACTN|nr:hypothetical protein DMO24_03305 [Modestobacter versicolor]